MEIKLNNKRGGNFQFINRKPFPLDSFCKTAFVLFEGQGEWGVVVASS
jgi:hypothetical protein